MAGGGGGAENADQSGRGPAPPLDRQRLPHRIVPEHPRLTGRYVGQAQQHQDGGGLAGAVRAQEPEDLAAPDGERHVVDGGRTPVALGEILRLDDGLAHRRPNLATAPTMTSNATPMIPAPAMPQMVEVVTVMRKLEVADSPRELARRVVT